MILLLDSHVLLWALDGGPALRSELATALENPANDVLVSAAAVWEIEVKRVAGRLTAPVDLLEAIGASRFATIPITAADARDAARLPLHHRDPFDRMLVAQAKRLDAILVTRDRDLAAYGVEVLPA
jgi:PIN domain nuclease of toxin-antitoxin system